MAEAVAVALPARDRLAAGNVLQPPVVAVPASIAAGRLRKPALHPV